MMKIIYGPDGFVLRVITAISENSDWSKFLAPGEQMIDGMAEPGIDKVVDGVLVSAPARPSMFHVFDKESFSWISDIQSAKDGARYRINQARNAAERAGFVAYGKPFDADDKAIMRVSVAAQAAQMALATNQQLSIDWTCADNTTITLSAEQLVELPVIMAQAANALHVHGRALKAQIEAATTIEEIEAIVW